MEWLIPALKMHIVGCLAQVGMAVLCCPFRASASTIPIIVLPNEDHYNVS